MLQIFMGHPIYLLVNITHKRNKLGNCVIHVPLQLAHESLHNSYAIYVPVYNYTIIVKIMHNEQ